MRVKSSLPMVVGTACILIGAAAVFFVAKWPRAGVGADPLAAVAAAAVDPSAAGGQPQASPAAPAAEGKEETFYTCPMHPTYVSKRPGACPICNMTLVPIKAPEAAPVTPVTAPGAPVTAPEAPAAPVEGHATVTISPEGRQMIGVQTGLVTKADVKKRIRAVGTVNYNETGLSSVNLKFSGWVQQLFVKSTGQAVRKGDPLLTVYSPDFLDAERNYLVALQSVESLGANPPPDAMAFARQTVESTRERLLLWDMSPEQLKSIEEKKEPERNITIIAKAEGVVIERNVLEGAYVEPGRDLYRIADLSTVWVEADVYEYEIALVKVGSEARITLGSYPGEEITGKVTYIYPYLNSQTRTVRARIEAPNADGRLKPGMYATVNIESDLGPQLVVDEGAILDTGARQIVFVVRDGGIFEPREVVAGQRTDGQVVILKGLSAGENVVTSGNFLVDSESRLKAAAAGAMAGMPGMPGMEMPAAGTPAQTRGAMESMPGMGAPAETKEDVGMEGMPPMPGMQHP